MHFLANIEMPDDIRMKTLTKIAQDFPHLLLTETDRGQLPLHLAFFWHSELSYIQLLWELTVKAAGDENIFCKKSELAVDAIAYVFFRLNTQTSIFVLNKCSHLLDSPGVGSLFLNQFCNEFISTQEHIKFLRLDFHHLFRLTDIYFLQISLIFQQN